MGEPYKCQSHNKWFDTYKDLEEHARKEHTRETFVDDVIGRLGSAGYSLKFREGSNDATELLVFEDVVAGKKFELQIREVD